MRADPSLADWWVRMEAEARPSKPSAALFRKDRPSYRQLREAVERRSSQWILRSGTGLPIAFPD